jgi:hypothetical protein
MGSSGPSGCECGRACGSAARAADGYGYGGTADDGGADAGGTGGHICAGADRDGGGAIELSTTIRSECNELPTVRRRRSRRGRGGGRNRAAFGGPRPPGECRKD